MADVFVTAGVLGFFIFLDWVSIFFVPIILSIWVHIRKKKRKAFAQNLALQSEESVILTNRKLSKISAFVIGACFIFLGTALSVPFVEGLSGHDFIEEYYIDAVLFGEIVAFYLAVMVISWLPAIRIFGRIIVVTDKGIVDHVALGKDVTIDWIEAPSLSILPASEKFSHVIAKDDRKIGFNWQMKRFWDMMAITKAKIPASLVSNPSNFLIKNAPAWYNDWIPSVDRKTPTKVEYKPGPKIKLILSWFGKVSEAIRGHRRPIFYLGLIMTFSGIAVEFAGAFLVSIILEVLGAILVIFGLFFVLVSYVVMRFAKSTLTLKEAEDEAGFGIYAYAFYGLLVTSLIIATPSVLENLAGRQSHLYIITPVVTDIFTLQGASLMLYFIFIVVAIVLSFIKLTKDGLMIYVKVLRGEEVPPECRDDNPFYGNVISDTLYFLLAIIFFSLATYIVVRLTGVVPVIPDVGNELWKNVFVFAQAAVWEEIVSRVLLLGIPLLLIDYIFRRRSAAKPSKYVLGGINRLGMVECGLVLFSSIMFGLAHIGGWDYYKVVPATVAGLFFGYLFVKFGLYAAIMLHFLNDFYDIPLQMISPEYAGTLPLVVVILGFFVFFFYLSGLLKFIKHDLMKIPAPASASKNITTDAISPGMPKQERKRLRKQFRNE